MTSAKGISALVMTAAVALAVAATVSSNTGCRDLASIPCKDDAGNAVACPCTEDAAPCCFDNEGTQVDCCTDPNGNVIDDDAGNHIACACTDINSNPAPCDCVDGDGNPIACSCLDDAGMDMCSAPPGCTDDAGNPVGCDDAGADAPADDGATE